MVLQYRKVNLAMPELSIFLKVKLQLVINISKARFNLHLIDSKFNCCLFQQMSVSY